MRGRQLAVDDGAGCVLVRRPVFERHLHAYYNAYYWFRVVFIMLVGSCSSLVGSSSSCLLLVPGRVHHATTGRVHHGRVVFMTGRVVFIMLPLVPGRVHHGRVVGRVVFIMLLPCAVLVVVNALLVGAMRAANARRAQLLRTQRAVAAATDNERTTMMLVVVAVVMLVVEFPMIVILLLHLGSSTGSSTGRSTGSCTGCSTGSSTGRHPPTPPR